MQIYNSVIMKPYCEIASQYLLPTLRALVAKNLMEKYKMTQQDAASKIGLTQSAVSQYMRQLRGSKIKIIEKDKSIMEEIDKFSGRVASGEFNSLSILDAFCEICRLSRKRRILCELHNKSFPELKDCNICLK
jgi:predicted transcriptional regulator